MKTKRTKTIVISGNSLSSKTIKDIENTNNVLVDFRGGKILNIEIVPHTQRIDNLLSILIEVNDIVKDN